MDVTTDILLPDLLPDINGEIQSISLELLLSQPQLSWELVVISPNPSLIGTSRPESDS